jgi:hypothetical protein
VAEAHAGAPEDSEHRLAIKLSWRPSAIRPHEEHDAMRARCSGDFNPTEFDLAVLNETLGTFML